MENVKCFQNCTIRVWKFGFSIFEFRYKKAVLYIACCLVFWYLAKEQLYKTLVMVEIIYVNFEICNHLSSNSGYGLKITNEFFEGCESQGSIQFLNLS